MLTHASCVHEIPNHTVVGADLAVRDEQGRVVDQLEPCQHAPVHLRPSRSGERPSATSGAHNPSTNGWVSWTQQYVPAHAWTWNWLSAIVVVPGAPRDQNALLYYFNGLEPQNGSQILQPVLQWGNGSPISDGGNFWGVSSYEVFSSGLAAHTPLARVNSGDNIAMDIYLSNVSNGCGYEWTSSGLQYVCGTNYQYVVSASDWTNGASVSATFNNYASGADAPPNGTFFPWAYPAVHESYGDVDCEPGVEFYAISLAANTHPSVLEQVWQAYSPSGQSNSYGTPSCFDSPYTNGTTTWVY
jgi:hypothetical protein